MRIAHLGGRLVLPDPGHPDPLVGLDVAEARASGDLRAAAGVPGRRRCVDLLPGDLIFTGTPAGVGVGQDPPRFLQHGDELRTWCEGIGELRHRFVSPP